MSIKIGDKVKGYMGHSPGTTDGRGQPVTGTVVRSDYISERSSVALIERSDGVRFHIFRATAELLPPELPLPPVVDWSKPLQTREGARVRLLAKDMDGKKSYAVAILTDKGEYATVRYASGRVEIEFETKVDIVNVPPPKMKRKCMIAMSVKGGIHTLDSWVDHTKIAPGVYIAFKEIEIEEGEGM